MDFKDSPEDAAWREEVRAWLESNASVVPKARRPSRTCSVRRTRKSRRHSSQRSKAWQKKLYEAGYAAITWPKDFGGRDASPMQSFILGQEMSDATTSRPASTRSVSG